MQGLEDEGPVLRCRNSRSTIKLHSQQRAKIHDE